MARKEIMIQDVRLSYPNLFKKVAFNDDKDPVFSAMFVFDDQGKVHKQVMSTLKGLLKEEFGDDAQSVWKALERKGRTVVHNGEEMEGKAGFSPEVSYLSAYNNTRPLVIGAGPKHKDPIAEEDGIIYPGCYGNAKLQFYTWKNGNGKGVGCELKGFQFTRDGEQLGGATAATADDFPDLDEEESAGSDWDGDDQEKDDDDWM